MQRLGRLAYEIGVSVLFVLATLLLAWRCTPVDESPPLIEPTRTWSI